MDQKEFGEQLRSLRKAKKLTLVKLAELSKVSNPYISQIENGKFVPSPEVLNKLAMPLGVTQFDLLRAAGYFADEEAQMRQREEFQNSMTPADFEDFMDQQDILRLREDYKKLRYPELDELLKYSNSLYFEKYKLNNEDKALVYKILKAIFEDKEKNYPTEEKIEEDFPYRKNFQEAFDEKESKKE